MTSCLALEVQMQSRFYSHETQSKLGSCMHFTLLGPRRGLIAQSRAAGTRADVCVSGMCAPGLAERVSKFGVCALTHLSES